MSRELPYFRWYPKDAESDSKYASLDLAELGLYHRCLNHSWLNDGIPQEISEISRELRIPEKEIRRLWPRVSKCFVLYTEDSRLRNPRQEKERNHAVTKSTQAAEAAHAKHARSASAGASAGASAMHSLSVRSADGVPRAYGSGSNGFFLKEKPLESAEWPNARDFREAWQRHLKQRKDQPMQLVVQFLIGRGSDIDWLKLNEIHPKYCDYWTKYDWSYCPLTLLEWIEGGMLPPPPPPRPKNGKPTIEELYGE